MTSDDFLAEISANPDDDTPRLIYADWLEERGDPRGEFIRVQCELAMLTKPASRWSRMYFGGSPYTRPEQWVRQQGDLPRFRELLARQLALKVAHSPEWVKPLGPQATGVIYSRGFVEGCSIRARDYAEHAVDWHRVTPLRQLHVKHIGEYLRAMLQCPTLRQIYTLEFEPSGLHIHDREVELLAACPYLVNLRHLILGFGEVGDRGVRAILDSPHLAKLETFYGPKLAVTASLQSALQARFG